MIASLTSLAEEIDRSKMAMYMAGLVSILRHSPYYCWNSLNKHGLLQLTASIDVMSSGISTHCGHDEAKLSAEYLLVGLKKVTRSSDIVKRHFCQYNINALTDDTLQKIKIKLENEVTKALSME